MSTKVVRLLTALAVLTFFSVAARAAEASIITLNFTGTINTTVRPFPVFGVTGTAVPFNFSITYDTALSPAPIFIVAGTTINGETANNDFYGYSASGVIGTNLTFGTHTWTAANLSALSPFIGVSAAFWADTDLSVATPTRFAASFVDGTAILDLGGIFGSGTLINLDTNRATILDRAPRGGEGRANFMTITSSAAPTVPEPTSLLLLGTGLIGFAARLRPSRRRS